MDNLITIKFFRVEKSYSHCIDFHEALDDLSAAFLFHIPTRVLLIQSNPQSVNQSRLSLYLNSINQAADYTFEPVARQDAWARFNSGNTRKLRMKLAAPENFGNLNIGHIGESLHAPYLTIEISMGRKRGALAQAAARRWIEGLLRFGQRQPGSVESLSASVTDGNGPDVIDFLEEQLLIKDELDLDDANPIANYTRRAAFLESKFNEYLPYLRSLYP